MEYNWEYVFNHWIPPGNIIASGYIFVASFEIYILIFKFKRRIYASLSCNSNSEENNEYLYLIIHLEF